MLLGVSADIFLLPWAPICHLVLFLGRFAVFRTFGGGDGLAGWQACTTTGVLDLRLRGVALVGRSVDRYVGPFRCVWFVGSFPRLRRKKRGGVDEHMERGICADSRGLFARRACDKL